MKKNTDSFPSGKYDTSEVSRRLYRGALDAARRLEEFLRGNPRPDMLGPDVTALRMRLKDYCERLLFSEPPEFGRKAEELMWRKVYYEPLQLHKQHKKGTATCDSPGDKDLLCGWLRAGVGHYHHLLLRLQAEFHLSQETTLVPQCPFRKYRGVRKERWGRHQRSVCMPGREEWATQTAHRCLMCLGDLARYLSDCEDLGSDFLSERYYRQAFQLCPTLGMPFNQMGTLAAMNQQNGCHALYFYLRCLLSPQSFEGAEGNIQRIFEKNQPVYEASLSISSTEDNNVPKCLLQRLLTRFLKLAELFFNQQENNLAALCQDVLQDLDSFLSLPDPTARGCSEPVGPAAINAEEGDEEDEDDIGLLFFRLGLVALMFFARLQIQGSPLVSAAAAFALSLLSQVVRHSLTRLQCALLLVPTQPLPTNCPSALQVNGAPEQPVGEQTTWTSKIEEDGTRTRSTSGTLTPIAANGATQEETNSNQSDDKGEQEEMGLSSFPSSSHRHKKRSCVLGHLRRRRRRNASSTSQDDSEVSNEEGDFGESDVDLGISSDISETGSVHGSEGSLTEQEDEDVTHEQQTNSGEDQFSLTNGEMDNKEFLEYSNGHSPSSDLFLSNGLPDQKENQQQTLTFGEAMAALKKESLFLALIKVLSDWLSKHPDILVACAQSTRSLWKYYADLLNVLLKAEAYLLNTEEPLASRFSALQCPRPSVLISNNKESQDGLNNNNNNNSSSDTLAKAAALSIWKWPHLLPEDAELQQLPILTTPFPATNKNGKIKVGLLSANGPKSWAKTGPTVGGKLGAYEQVFGRVQCLLHFALSQAIPQPQKMQPFRKVNQLKNGYLKSSSASNEECLLRFSPEENCFFLSEPNSFENSNQSKTSLSELNKKNGEDGLPASIEETAGDLEGQRKQLMRNMAHLWLKAEVQDLEVRTGNTRWGNGKGRPHSDHRSHHQSGGRHGMLQAGCLPPYLVPDAGALCHQLPALKQLQAARRFVIILPASVISSLDELKRQSAFAREAIRWIEAELRAGSRFLRPQKTQERLTLLPMKYPKRKEKEAWDFFQVLECCHYLNNSHSQGRQPSAPLVTLVTGGNQFLPPNANAVANSAGITMESVEDFLSKWHGSFKS